MEEVRLTRKGLGWGVDELAMRLTMLSFLRGRNKDEGGRVPPEVLSITFEIVFELSIYQKSIITVDNI